MRRYLGHLIRSAERRVEHFKCTGPGPVQGGLRGHAGGRIEGKPTIYALARGRFGVLQPGQPVLP